MKRIIRNSLLASLILSFVLLPQKAFSGILDSWQEEEAYKPNPVLFLHGFANGSPEDWKVVIDSLQAYYAAYEPIGRYLETMDFGDANGSVDEYSPGKLNPQGTSEGWAQKVLKEVELLLLIGRYSLHADKINLICHSMGGLAGRWYLENYISAYVDKIIMIGTPNLGSKLSNIADFMAKTQKYGLLFAVVPYVNYFVIGTEVINCGLMLFLNIDVGGEAVEDLSPSDGGENFIFKLNDKPQPTTVDYFGIIAKTGHIFNWYIAKDYYGGDSIVSAKSQLGYGEVSMKYYKYITATHWSEIRVAANEENNIFLKHLDSDQPEIRITSPDPGQVTEINETYVNIKGTVSKEYLPANSELIITIYHEESGLFVSEQRSLLRPTDLWVPKDPASPVAEFDEAISLPAIGTYRISCQVRNPAEVLSEAQAVRVRVLSFGQVPLVVHCHNPEGKEINSIHGMFDYGMMAEIYLDGNKIGKGSAEPETHGVPFFISAGPHAVSARFNSIQLNEYINLQPGESAAITFVFPREEVDTLVPPCLSEHAVANGHSEISGYEEFLAFDGAFTDCTLRVIDGSITSDYAFDVETVLNGWGYEYHNHSHFEGSAYYSVVYGNAYARTDVSCLQFCGIIPPSVTSASVWFTQGLYSDPAKDLTPNLTAAPPNRGGGYGFGTLKNYLGLEVNFELKRQETGRYKWAGAPSEIQFNKDEALSLSDWKISTVPYDLLGTAQ